MKKTNPEDPAKKTSAGAEEAASVGATAQTPEAEPLSNAARVLRSRGGVSQPEEPEAPVHRTLGSRIGDFWYFHKWTFLTVTFFLIIGLVATVQLVGKKAGDVAVMYAGPAYLGESATKQIQAALESAAEDWNGDGKTKVTFSTLVYSETGTNPPSALMGFRAEMTSGDSGVYFLSPYLCGMAAEDGLLKPLSEVLDEVPASAVSDYAVPLRETALYRASPEVFAGLPEDTVVCLRMVTFLNSVQGEKKAQTAYERHCRFFRTLVG